MLQQEITLKKRNFIPGCGGTPVTMYVELPMTVKQICSRNEVGHPYNQSLYS